jgi:hypothetical protein
MMIYQQCWEGTKLGTRSFSNIGMRNGLEFRFLRNVNENFRYYEKL